jgi:signal transduction histidine kinase
MRDDEKRSKIVELEKLAELLKDRCFERIDDCIFPADYEIRGIEVFDFIGQRFLSYGDKSGVLQVYKLENMTTRKPIIKENLKGIIDILSFKEMPGNQGLLFVGVRFQGMYVYHFSVENGKETYKRMSPVLEEKKFISFFFPNIFFNKNDKLARFEVWICFDDGDFRIYTGSFPGEQWEIKGEKIQLSYVLESYTIDHNESIYTPGLFMGNSAGDIFYIPFSEFEGLDFPKDLNDENIKILTIHGAVIEAMIPLSDYRRIKSDKGPGELFYPEYCGCMVKLNNKIICIYFDRQKGRQEVLTLTKVFSNCLLDIKCLSFSDCCYTVVSDIENKLHLVKNITDMEPAGENIEVIFDGEAHTIEFNDRICKFCFSYFQKQESKEDQIIHKAYLGMGNHRVLPLNIYDYNAKLKYAGKVFFDMLDLASGEIDKIDEVVDRRKVLGTIEEILEKYRYWASRTAIKQLLMQLLAELTKGYCQNTKDFLYQYRNEFSRIFYKIIENEETELVIKASEFLTGVEKYCRLSPEVITELQVHVKKFILDKRSYSIKSENIEQLVKYNEDCGNLVDALVYRGILCDRQYDKLSQVEFTEKDGEITSFTPLKDKFIVCTSKGKVFLIDLEVKEKRMVFQYSKDQQISDTYKIDNIYKGRDKIYLLVHEQKILILNSEKLLSSYHQNIPISLEEAKQVSISSGKGLRYGTAVCRMPHHKDKEDEYLIGTNRGEILHMLPSEKALELYRDTADTYAIMDLRSFQANNRFFFAAAYWNGIVKVFEFFPGNIKNQTELLHRIPVDANSVNRLYVFSDIGEYTLSPLVVAGTDSGRCYGIRMRFNRSEKDSIHFVYEWCYRCVEAVKGIHPFSLTKDRHYIQIASMDNHLHILKRNGISVNTIHLKVPLIQVYTPLLNTKSEIRNIVGYLMTSDNKFQKTQFYIKKDIMKRINKCFSGERKGYEEFGKKDKEITLLKFKSIGINEDHFKIRYYLMSEKIRFPVSILDEIEALFESGSGKIVEKTHALKALIQRLFCSCFNELLGDPKKYERTKRLFKRTIDQWEYEGSKNNIKAQLYWIRSMLKGCRDSGNPVLMFNNWFNVSKEVAIRYKMREVDSTNIVQHFIIHPIPFFRVKALHYIHRYITSQMDRVKEQEKTEWEPGLVVALSESVIKVLKMSWTKDDEAPLWFELEAVRFLTWMGVNYKSTGLCPAKLCYDLWKDEISPSFFSRFSDAMLIYPREVRKREIIASMFQAAGRLLKELERDKPQVDDIFPGLTEFCLKNCACFGEKNQKKDHTMLEELRQEFITFFQSISKLLLYKKIDNFSDISKLEKLPIDKKPKYFKSSIKVLNEFYDLSQYIQQYYYEKHKDIYEYTLNALKYETFYNIKYTINRIERTIKHLTQEKKEKQSLWLERKLYAFVLNQWENFIKDEVDNYLILDFANAIRVYNERCIDEHEFIDMPLIFRNIFTRLNVMAECDESYLVYLKKESKELIIIHNNKEGEEILSIEDVKKDPTNYVIPLEWLEPKIFVSLAESDITQQFKSRISRFMVLKVPGPEPAATSTVYLFFWNIGESNGLSRFESREILGEFLTTMAYLQYSLREQRERQEEFFRIVSHELNQIIRGLLNWISNLQTGHMEDKTEKRKEYYNRFQYSLVSADHIIKSMLSFRDIARFDLKSCELDKELEKIVKLARIQYKEPGNVQLNFDANNENYEIVTDPALVGTAVMNMLTNARKYNPERKPVEMRMFTEGSKIVIEVEDKGVGIPRNEYDIVFKRFERGSYARKNKIDGLGIGLAASKNNIELLGGTITFQSQEGKGSVFRITLNKAKFQKYHMLVTKEEVKKPPDFSLIQDFTLRQKIEEKLSYDAFGRTLTLRGVLTEEQYQILVQTYAKDKKTGAFNRKALEKLHRKSIEELNKMQIDQNKEER